MNYLAAMGRILSLTPFSSTEPAQLKHLQLYSIINVLILGLIYGLSAAFFSRILMIDAGGITDSGMAKIIIAGIPAAFFMHAGTALFLWVFLKAIGGKSEFITAYFHIGAAAISLWPLAPFVAILQISPPTGLLLLFTGVFCCYAFTVNILVVKQAFRLSALRMAIATSITVIYISCFLYLWL